MKKMHTIVGFFDRAEKGEYYLIMPTVVGFTK